MLSGRLAPGLVPTPSSATFALRALSRTLRRSRSAAGPSPSTSWSSPSRTQSASGLRSRSVWDHSATRTPCVVPSSGARKASPAGRLPYVPGRVQQAVVGVADPAAEVHPQVRAVGAAHHDAVRAVEHRGAGARPARDLPPVHGHRPREHQRVEDRHARVARPRERGREAAEARVGRRVAREARRRPAARRPPRRAGPAPPPRGRARPPRLARIRASTPRALERGAPAPPRRTAPRGPRAARRRACPVAAYSTSVASARQLGGDLGRLARAAVLAHPGGRSPRRAGRRTRAPARSSSGGSSPGTA